MKLLFILNDPPYGTERSYNGLRLANTVAKQEGTEVKVFLMGDAASCAKSGQSVPQGYYSIERMLKALRLKDGEVAVCGTCMDARGIRDEELGDGQRRGTMDDLAEWTVWADKLLVF
jgi:uncharacterized protein involved in oxidation of intracellular sulfur